MAMPAISIVWAELLELAVSLREAKALQQGLAVVYDLAQGGSLVLGTATAVIITGHAVMESTVNVPLVQKNLEAIQAGLLDSFVANTATPMDFDDPGKLSTLMGKPISGVVPRTLQELVRSSAQQLVKGGLIVLALTAEAEYLLRHIEPFPFSNLTLTSIRISALVDILKNQMSSLNIITTSWRQWIVDHYAKRKAYGMVTANWVSLYRHEILQQKLAALSSIIDHDMVFAFTAAHKDGSLDQYQELWRHFINYATQVHQISLGIRDKESLMIRDGLKTHEIDSRRVLSTLMASDVTKFTQLSKDPYTGPIQERMDSFAAKGLFKTAFESSVSGNIFKEILSWMKKENGDDGDKPPEESSSLGLSGHYAAPGTLSEWKALQDKVKHAIDELKKIPGEISDAIGYQSGSIIQNILHEMQTGSGMDETTALQEAGRVDNVRSVITTVRDQLQRLIENSPFTGEAALYLGVRFTFAAITLRRAVSLAREMVGTFEIVPELGALLERAQNIATELDTVADQLFHNRKFVFNKAPPM